MMTEVEKDIVTVVYRRFLDNETEEMWSDLDENLLFVEFLNDQEMVNEAKIKIERHKEGIFRCRQAHNQESCFAPFILEAVEIITKIYDKGDKILHPHNRYILTYYISMSELGLIFVET